MDAKRFTFLGMHTKWPPTIRERKKGER